MESLLFLAHRIPYPPNKGDKIRSFHFLKWMRERYRVHLGAFVDDPADRQHVPVLERMCASVYLPSLNPRLARLRSLRGLLRRESLTEAYYRHPAMQSWVDDTIHRHRIGRIFVFSSGMAHFALPHAHARRVMDFVDMDSDKWRQYGAARGRIGGAIYRREAEKLLNAERHIAREFDASIFVSPAEAALFASQAPESAQCVHAIENGVDTDYFTPAASGANPHPADERAIVFTGAMDYHANVDAVDWFAREVFPAVRAAQPAARFCIVGGHPAPAVRRLGEIEGITVTGAVPDVRPWLAHAHVAVAPLRIARGVQNKVLEAMAMERRVVLTPQAAEGIHPFDDLSRDVAHDADTFAQKVLALLADEPIRAVTNREFVLRHYNWERNLERLGPLLEGARSRSPVPPLIAHIIYRLDVGGLENGVVNLINAMPADRFRHAIICLTDYSDFRKRIRRPDVQVFALRKRDGKDFGVYARLFRLLRSLGPDIVHTRNLATLDCQFVAALAGVPGRVHGEHGWDVIDVDGTNRKYNLLRRFMRRFVRRYVPLSVELEEWLRKTVRVRPERIARIYNGVNTERFAPAQREILAAGQPIVIGTVGRMQTVKDQPVLARAFVRLNELFPAMRGHLRLTMIGDGSLRQEVERVIEQAGLQQQVSLPGAREDVPEQLRAMDIFVLPSIAEGISNTILEAMATGLPVVATRVGGNAELVVEGETGLLVPPSDTDALAKAIGVYVADPALARRHGAAGRNRVLRDFSMERMLDRYLAVYDDLVSVRPVAA